MRVARVTFTGVLLSVVLASGFAMAATWTGYAKYNGVSNKKCPSSLNYTLTSEGGKVKLHIEFPTVSRDVEADLATDGKFATTYTNLSGNTIHVYGRINGDGGKFSLDSKGPCSFLNIPLGN